MAFPPVPDYSQMIMEAIEALSSKEKATKDAISDFIESNYTDLPPTHVAHVTLTLDKMKQSGQLTLVKDEYVVNEQFEEADEELAEDDDEPTNGVNPSPMKRGRGRPAKPKSSVPSGPSPSPRPRGRPPKERDPLAPVSTPTKAPSSGRPRGRPRKNPSEVGVSVSTGGGTGVVGGVKKGRGRPRKS